MSTMRSSPMPRRGVRGEAARLQATPSKLTLGDWLDQWLEEPAAWLRPLTSYAENVRLHLKPKLGGVPLVKLTGTKITTHYRELETDGRQDHKKGQGHSARTVRYIHTILKAALREAVRALIPLTQLTKRSHRSRRRPRHLRFTHGPLRSLPPFRHGPTSAAALMRFLGRLLAARECAGERLSRCAGAIWT